MPLSSLTRRTLIACAGTVIASTALAVPFVHAVRSDEMPSLATRSVPSADRITQLIERHERLWLAFENACDEADPMSERFAGPGAETKRDRLCLAEKTALLALMRAPVSDRVAAGRKATYLLTTIGYGGRWEPDVENVAALISSLL